MRMLRWAAAAVLVAAGSAALVSSAGRAETGSAHDPELDAMIGQMIMIGFQGTSPKQAPVRRVLSELAAGKIGGVILMGVNVRSRAQTAALTSSIRNAGAPHVPFIAVDQEGGAVQRLSRGKGFHGFPSPRLIAARQDPGAARKTYSAMAGELKEHGFNVNFGPIVDLNRNRSNPVIGRLGRSYGADPAQVTAYARAFIHAHRRAGILTAVKHFPGHGSSFTDSHKRFVDLTKTWNPIELEPYRGLAAGGEIDMVMIGHLYHPSFSGGARLPATFSREAIEGLLRRDIGFNGVVISDDLGMGAITRYHSVNETLLRAVEAGNDILLFASTPRVTGSFADYSVRVIREAVVSGRIPRSRIEQSYRRILALKQRIGDGVSAVPAAYSPDSAVWRHPDTGRPLP